MKTSKEIKVLAAVIALCLLVGIGCGAAAMGSASVPGAAVYADTIDGVEFSGAVATTNTVLMKNMAPITFPEIEIGTSITVISAGETNDGPSPVQRQGLFE